MKVRLGAEFEFELFDIEEARQVEKLAEVTDGIVYSWKTEGRYNWFERGFTVIDVLGLTVLPKGLPEWIDLPNDQATS
jgi:hypothetical protein